MNIAVVSGGVALLCSLGAAVLLLCFSRKRKMRHKSMLGREPSVYTSSKAPTSSSGVLARSSAAAEKRGSRQFSRQQLRRLPSTAQHARLSRSSSRVGRRMSISQQHNTQQQQHRRTGTVTVNDALAHPLAQKQAPSSALGRAKPLYARDADTAVAAVTQAAAAATSPAADKALSSNTKRDGYVALPSRWQTANNYLDARAATPATNKAGNYLDARGASPVGYGKYGVTPVTAAAKSNKSGKKNATAAKTKAPVSKPKAHLAEAATPINYSSLPPASLAERAKLHKAFRNVSSSVAASSLSSPTCRYILRPSASDANAFALTYLTAVRSCSCESIVAC